MGTQEINFFKGEKMKKKLTLLAALVLSLGVFSACGNNADKKEEAPQILG